MLRRRNGESCKAVRGRKEEYDEEGRRKRGRKSGKKKRTEEWQKVTRDADWESQEDRTKENSEEEEVEREQKNGVKYLRPREAESKSRDRRCSSDAPLTPLREAPRSVKITTFSRNSLCKLMRAQLKEKRERLR